MLLSEKQKDFIDFLIKGKDDYNDVNQYLTILFMENNISLKYNACEGNFTLIRLSKGVVTDLSLAKFIPIYKEVKIIYSIIISIIDLVNNLEKNGLIRTYTTAIKNTDFIIGSSKSIGLANESIDKAINTKLLELLQQTIIVDDKLIEFKKRNYLTETEYYDRLKIKISIAAIITSIGLGLSGIFRDVISNWAMSIFEAFK